MRVRLADVGDPLALDPFSIGRGGARARSFRRQAGGEGGGGGGTDDTGGGTDDADKDDDDTDDAADKDDDADDADDKDDAKKTVPKTELDKAIKRRDAAIAARRKAEEALRRATEKADDKADPVAEANAKIVRTSAHGILRGLGVEDKADRAAVLDILKLDDIEVDADGADEDAIEERIDDLRRILGAGVTPPKKRVPKGVDTRDKGGKGDTKTDPDEARYKRILGRR